MSKTRIFRFQGFFKLSTLNTNLNDVLVIRSFVCLFVRSFVHSFVCYLFVCSSVCSFVFVKNRFFSKRKFRLENYLKTLKTFCHNAMSFMLKLKAKTFQKSLTIFLTFYSKLSSYVFLFLFKSTHLRRFLSFVL